VDEMVNNLPDKTIQKNIMSQQNRKFRILTKIESSGSLISYQLVFGLYNEFVFLLIIDALSLSYRLLLVSSALSRFCVFDFERLLCYV